MDTRKVTLIATIAAIALVAVGIGYAYTASTQNGGNSLTSEYITMVQTGTYIFANDIHVEWDTEDVKETNIWTKFKLNGATQVADTPIASYYTKSIGTFTIKTQGQSVTSPASLNCAITTSQANTWNVFTGEESHGTTFFLKVVNNGNIDWFKWDSTNKVFKKYVTSDWTGDAKFTITYADSVYKDTEVTVYYGTDVQQIAVIHTAGNPPAGPTTKPLDGASLTFTVTKS